MTQPISQLPNYQPLQQSSSNPSVAYEGRMYTQEMISLAYLLTQITNESESISSISEAHCAKLMNQTNEQTSIYQKYFKNNSVPSSNARQCIQLGNKEQSANVPHTPSIAQDLSSTSSKNASASALKSKQINFLTQEKNSVHKKMYERDAKVKRKRSMQTSKNGIIRNQLQKKRGRKPQPHPIKCATCSRSEAEIVQWRCGPTGPGTLCNPCGLRFAKSLPNGSIKDYKKKLLEDKRKNESLEDKENNKSAPDKGKLSYILN